MNARADDLVRELRTLLGTLPGATTLSLHVSKTWTLVLIATASDAAVPALGEALGLGAAEVARGVGGWWRRAAAARDQGTLSIVVAGPHHRGRPPHAP